MKRAVAATIGFMAAALLAMEQAKREDAKAS
jgi:hypothetical protein